MVATVQQQASSRPTPFNPEGVLMLAVAIFADFIFNAAAFILYPVFGLGEIVSWAGDIFFTVTLGLWMLLRGGQGGVKKGKMAEFFKKRFPWILAEFIPIIGILLPAWTINVVLFLHQKGSPSKIEPGQAQPQTAVSQETPPKTSPETLTETTHEGWMPHAAGFATSPPSPYRPLTVAGDEEEQTPPTSTQETLGTSAEEPLPPTPIGSRGFTIRKDLRILSGVGSIFILEHPDGREWHIDIRQIGNHLYGNILPSKDKGGSFMPPEKRLLRPTEQALSRSELLEIVSYIAKTFPDAETLSGLRETVGHAKVEQSINLERFREGKPAPTKTPAAPSRKTADMVLAETEIRGDAVNGERLTQATLAQQGLGPQYEVAVGPVEIELSSPYDAGNGTTAVVAYTHDEGKTTARTYYQSATQGIWRYLPDYATKDGQVTGYGAGYGAESVALPIALQAALGELTQKEKPKTVEKPELVFRGTTHEYGRRIDDFYKKVGNAGQRLSGNFYPAKPNEKTPPEQMTLNSAQMPNFNILLLRWRQKTRIYGTTIMEIFPSKDDTLRFLFCRDARGRAWIGSIERAESAAEVTSIGINPLWINGGDLTTPAYEYASRAGEYGNTRMKAGRYVDMYENYLSKIPVIREYKKRGEQAQPLMKTRA